MLEKQKERERDGGRERKGKKVGIWGKKNVPVVGP